MTPRAVKPLTVTPGNGVTPASTKELVQTQNAILLSNAGVLGAVTQMQTDIGKRLDRQFGDTAESLQIVEGKVDGLDGRLGSIEESRRTDAALAVQAKGFAADNATQAKETAADAKTTATERNTDRAAHALSRNQRLAIIVTACVSCASLAVTLFLGLLNYWNGP